MKARVLSPSAGLALVLSCAPGGAPARAPSSAPRDAELAWIASKTLDTDAQVFVLRAYDEELVFPFRVWLSAPPADEEAERLARRRVVLEGEGTERVARARPADVAALVESAAVISVRCAPPMAALPQDESWRSKVDPDVRTVFATGSPCPTAVHVRWSRLAGDAERAQVEALGVLFRTFDAKTAVAYVPVRQIHALAALPFVEAVEPASRAYGE